MSFAKARTLMRLCPPDEESPRPCLSYLRSILVLPKVCPHGPSPAVGRQAPHESPTPQRKPSQGPSPCWGSFFPFTLWCIHFILDKMVGLMRQEQSSRKNQLWPESDHSLVFHLLILKIVILFQAAPTTKAY